MKRRGALAVLGLGLLTCHQAILTAPVGSSILLVVNPPSIPANGGVAVVSAHVIEPAGTVVPDGTVVQFFTTLGHIDEQGKTNDGVARVNLVSDSRSGTADVIATSGIETSEAASVTIGTANVTDVIVTADPSRITASRSTHIFANVRDKDGNPVPNVAVIFEVTASSPAPIMEWMDNGGRPLNTDNNGRAEDVMRTNYAREAASKTVTVTATVSGKLSKTTTVTIN